MQTKPSATLGKSYLQNPDTKKTKRLAKERPRGKQNRPGTPKSLIPGGGNPSATLGKSYLQNPGVTNAYGHAIQSHP
jgi:hypothetical protein